MIRTGAEKDHDNVQFLLLNNRIKEHNGNSTGWAIFLRRNLLNVFFFSLVSQVKTTQYAKKKILYG